MWLTKYNISYYAYQYCRYVKDCPEIRKHITESKDAYWYCKNVKDDPEVRKHITNKYQLEELERRRNVDT